KAVSDRFISRATSCIHRSSRGAGKTQTAAGFPRNGVSVNASTWTTRSPTGDECTPSCSGVLLRLRSRRRAETVRPHRPSRSLETVMEKKLDKQRIQEFARKLVGFYARGAVTLMLHVGYKTGPFAAAASGPGTRGAIDR